MAFRSLACLTTALVLFGLATGADATSCAPGSYSSSGSAPCELCPPGTWQDQSGARSCRDAQSGWYATGPGATSQSQCQQGYYSTGLAAECTICPAGSHCNGVGNNQPQLCQPGRFSANPGAGQDCEECPPGTASNTYGATSCCPCCAGWFTSNRGQTHCQRCPNRGPFQQGYSPVGASSADQCTAATGGLATCDINSSTCPPTSGSVPSSGAQKRNAPFKTLARPRRCPQGQSLCPVYGSFSGSGYLRAYECLDTESDLESCGGCVDNDSIHGEKNLHGGRDCSAIPNVGSVRCSQGDCVIESCKPGYAVDGSRCRPIFPFEA